MGQFLEKKQVNFSPELLMICEFGNLEINRHFALLPSLSFREAWAGYPNKSIKTPKYALNSMLLEKSIETDFASFLTSINSLGSQLDISKKI